MGYFGQYPTLYFPLPQLTVNSAKCLRTDAHPHSNQGNHSLDFILELLDSCKQARVVTP